MTLHFQISCRGKPTLFHGVWVKVVTTWLGSEKDHGLSLYTFWTCKVVLFGDRLKIMGCRCGGFFTLSLGWDWFLFPDFFFVFWHCFLIQFVGHKHLCSFADIQPGEVSSFRQLKFLVNGRSRKWLWLIKMTLTVGHDSNSKLLHETWTYNTSVHTLNLCSGAGYKSWATESSNITVILRGSSQMFQFEWTLNSQLRSPRFVHEMFSAILLVWWKPETGWRPGCDQRRELMVPVFVSCCWRSCLSLTGWTT